MGTVFIIITIVTAVLGFIPSISKPRPLWQIIITILLLSTAIFFSLIIPSAIPLEKAGKIMLQNKSISSKIQDSDLLFAKNQSTINDFKIAYPVVIDYKPVSISLDSINSLWHIKIASTDNSYSNQTLYYMAVSLPQELCSSAKIVVTLGYDNELNGFIIHSVLNKNPLMTFPYIIGLEENIRIFFYHVPAAWVSMLGFIIALIFSIMYLVKKKIEFDALASASAELGLLFCIIATVTGMFWARVNWGSFWSWDPRQTSILILIFIYGAYFTLRATIINPSMKAKLSSVYAIIAGIVAPFFIFVLPRISSGLHPGSTDQGASPIITGKEGMISDSLLFVFSLSLGGFVLLYYWLLNIRFRVKKLNNSSVKSTF